jgi:polar amino acid transport system permease protein
MAKFFEYLTLPYLLEGIWITLQLTVMGFAGGMVLGALLAAMQLTRFAPLTVLARAYVTLYRGTPLILQLVFVFSVLPRVGVTFPPLVAGGVALALNEAVFFAEIFRSGIRGVDPGQTAAGRALGMVPAMLMRRIIAPQAFRAVVPALGNEAVSTMKNSALASIIAVPELTLRTQQLASATFDYFEIYFATAVLYLGLTGLFTVIQLLVERGLNQDRAPGTQRSWLRRPSRAAGPVPATRAPLPAGPAGRALPRVVGARVVTNGRPADGTARDGVAPRRPTQADPPPRSFGDALLEGYGLRKSYGANEVLRGIDLTVRQGEVIALLGPSGSGKSTLLRTINHLEGLDGGAILVGGTAIGYDERGRELRERSIARQRVAAGVGMVFQQFNLFHHLTVRENIAGPLRWVHGISRADADARADALLEQVGLTSRADALPRHLSGGQQQRVGIARALAPRPRVLLLDEPTSALDPELVGEVLTVIQDLAADDGLTMIIATHQLGFAHDVADRVIFMAGGVIVEQGPPEQVITNPHHELTRRFVGAIDTSVIDTSVIDASVIETVEDHA